MLLASCCGNSVSAQGTRDVQGKALYGLFFYSASIRTWVAFKTLLKRFFSNLGLLTSMWQIQELVMGIAVSNKMIIGTKGPVYNKLRNGLRPC